LEAPGTHACCPSAPLPARRLKLCGCQARQVHGQALLLREVKAGGQGQGVKGAVLDELAVQASLAGMPYLRGA
jgi:hypothetical protein